MHKLQTQRFTTKGRLSAGQARALVSKLTYSLECVANCRFDEEQQEIVFELFDESRLAQVEATVEQMIVAEKKIKAFRRNVLKETEPLSCSDDKLSADIDHLFAHNGTVRKGLALQLYDRLEQAFLGLATQEQAEQRRYPSMISHSTLHKCNYIRSFPQNIQMMAEFPHEYDVLREVQKTSDDSLHTLARTGEYALSPAVCFHCYEEMSDAIIDGSLTLTAQVACFRHEVKWRVGGHRLQEFAMREIVFFGEETAVEATRHRLIEQVWALFLACGLSGHIENANDPFYYNEDSPKLQYQLMGNMKYELIVTLPSGGDSFSIASFNHVGDTLCRTFNIRDTNDHYLNSGCVAFGIDRWVYALLHQYGPELAKWPEGVKTALNLSTEVS